MFAFLYVSRSTLLRGEEEEAEIGRIVDQSKRWNRTVEITGALMHTGRHFVQWLEGSEEDLRRLMLRIKRDVRHKDVTVLIEGPSDHRIFPDWSLAYRGRSTFAERLAEQALSTLDPLSTRHLKRLLQELVDPHQKSGLEE